MSTQLPQTLNFDTPTEPSELELDQFALLAQLGEGEAKPVEAETQQKQDYFVNTELQDGKLVVTYIGSSYTPEEANLLLDYYPRLYGVHSEHLGYQILTEKHVFLHLEAEGLKAPTEEGNVVIGKRRGRPGTAMKKEAETKYRTEYQKWEALCSERKTRAKSKRAEVRALVAERDEMLLDYNRRIAILRSEASEIEAEPVPPRPSQF